MRDAQLIDPTMVLSLTCGPCSSLLFRQFRDFQANELKRASRKKNRAMASFIFFTVLYVFLVGILWMRLTAVQSRMTGTALVPLVGQAAPGFTLLT